MPLDKTPAPSPILIRHPSLPRHPSLFEPATFILIVILCIFGAIIGLQLLTTLGVTPNTSLIGAIGAMAIARLPFAVFKRFRSIHIQNLAQSAISAATFGAANSLLLPIGIPFVLGRNDLILPMLAGVSAAMLLDAYLLYRTFGSKVFPAEGAWPPGVAAAEAIKAGDEGGRKALVLGIGLVAGIVGSFFSIPMSAFGTAFIGNIWALTMFGLGLLTRGYSSTLFTGDLFAGIVPGGDIAKAFIPHGFMIGAGLVALVQVVWIILQRDDADHGSGTPARPGSTAIRRTLGMGGLGYIAIASFIALAGGLTSELSTGLLIAFVLYAAFAAFVHELIVGLAAMHSGWFPAFAVALITLIIGILIGFPPVALALLVGFSAATGPAFADMGYDLKAGYILRQPEGSLAFEMDGRRQQLYAAMAAFLVSIIVVFFVYEGYFTLGLVPPVDKVYLATIKAGVAPEIGMSLVLWAIPGAILQLLGGPKRQLGVLFATGLLIPNAAAGWAVLVGIAARAVWIRTRGPAAKTTMEVFAGGVIAGDALFGFFGSVAKNVQTMSWGRRS